MSMVFALRRLALAIEFNCLSIKSWFTLEMCLLPWGVATRGLELTLPNGALASVLLPTDPVLWIGQPNSLEVAASGDE